MKFFVLIAVICATAMFVACGGDDSTVESDSTAQVEKPVNEEFIEHGPKPTIKPPSTPPKELVVKDLKEGSGPPAKDGDMMTVEYLSVDMAGVESFSTWGGAAPLTFRLGGGAFFPGWDLGLKGMRVGGRREILIPARLTGGSGTLIYVVDLLEIS